MRPHWQLALGNAVWIAALAVVVGVVIVYFYGVADAGAFGYGVGVGMISLISTALTVSLLTGRSMAGGMMIGGASFAGRFGFATAALGVPAYLGAWPVVAMLGGFAGVYLTENVVLLPKMLSRIGGPDSGHGTGHLKGDGVERRAEA